ncbi:AbrB/MazE/SpoVT family DNA-binding domain-containing protein [Vannielia litorea]|uniref:Looped-hinge helix DNA binding domain-containing protein, AbrB family n=1 Tax=Vannielia litorea TaxID=1217970 RepID=A0A1N6E8V0_9RHOB|nr:type II toxin-antitoxin system PrlF family antitoxin [Vannielia litorea]SIN79460.1 looped-hinge helix DNA binding domain-containing protein, AbrB family [Vannielia litorea]
MSLISKITSKGQTTLPSELRTALDLMPGDRIRYVKEADGSYRIVKLSGSFADLKGALNLGRPVELDEISEAVGQARTALGRGHDRS